jgi:RNA polymerase sigma-70 factor (ECF subfamily)
MSEHALRLPPSVPAPRVDSAGPDLKAQLAVLYREHFQFVWRCLRRLGVRESSIDDAVHDVFLVVHRKLAAFEERAGHRGWLFAIALRVAREYRRRDDRMCLVDPTDTIAGAVNPDDCLEVRSRAKLLGVLLDTLNGDQREVFVMAEVEGFSASEIAEVLGIRLNTVYSRLRLARKHFERALAQHAARSRGAPVR